MRASVVIPAYNESAYLRRTLEAVLAMDYPDFEVIVVDNASSDGTADIARSFPGVKVLREERKGTHWARECGRRAATGEIIAGVDADCMPARDWLTVGTSFFSSPDVVSVSGPYDYYDGGVFRYVSRWFQEATHWLMNDILVYFGKGGVLIAGNCLIRAEALEKIGGYDTSFVFWGDDTDTVKRLSKLGRPVFSNKVIMKSSSRRFKRDGVFKAWWGYLVAFLRETFRKES